VAAPDRSFCIFGVLVLRYPFHLGDRREFLPVRLTEERPSSREAPDARLDRHPLGTGQGVPLGDHLREAPSLDHPTGPKTIVAPATQIITQDVTLPDTNERTYTCHCGCGGTFPVSECSSQL